MGYIKIIIFTILLLFFIIIGVKQQIDINIMKDQNLDLKERCEQLIYENEKMRKKLEAPMDEEYIRDAAAKEGFKDPNAQYFYNDSPQ